MAIVSPFNGACLCQIPWKCLNSVLQLSTPSLSLFFLSLVNETTDEGIDGCMKYIYEGDELMNCNMDECEMDGCEDTGGGPWNAVHKHCRERREIASSRSRMTHTPWRTAFEEAPLHTTFIHLRASTPHFIEFWNFTSPHNGKDVHINYSFDYLHKKGPTLIAKFAVGHSNSILTWFIGNMMTLSQVKKQYLKLPTFIT